MIENDNTTSTVEIDLNGGWKVTHFTRTWDVRERLDTLAPTLDDKKAQLATLQAEVAELENQKAQVDALPADVKAAILAPLPTAEATTTATSLLPK